jgi:uncharacterized membrane protein
MHHDDPTLQQCRALLQALYGERLHGVVLLGSLLSFGVGVLAGMQQKPAPSKKQSVGPAAPAAPQSKHYPILLLAFGSEPPFNLRIGLKGPERLDRDAYPPIALEPGEVTTDAADAWTYRAKDTGTGAQVSLRLTREACADAKTGAKSTFHAILEHAQLGTFNGCARVATELFPKINNRPDDEEDPDKKKPAPVETVTSFQPPVAVAYLNPAKKVILKRGKVATVVAPEGSQLALSNDGKRLLYTRESKGTASKAIVLYDSATAKSGDFLQGEVQQPFWSPDDSRIAFMKSVDGHWRLWVAPVAAPETGAQVFPADIVAIHGWVDAHTLLVDDLQQLSWVGDDGSVKQTLSANDLYGTSYGASSSNTVRVHPLNADLLLASAETKPAADASAAGKPALGAVFFMYEIRSKRRDMLSSPDMLARVAEWSRDGLQIYFSGTDASKRIATYRVFWDGTSLKRYSDGTNLVIGQ